DHSGKRSSCAPRRLPETAPSAPAFSPPPPADPGNFAPARSCLAFRALAQIVDDRPGLAGFFFVELLQGKPGVQQNPIAHPAIGNQKRADGNAVAVQVGDGAVPLALDQPGWNSQTHSDLILEKFPGPS